MKPNYSKTLKFQNKFLYVICYLNGYISRAVFSNLNQRNKILDKSMYRDTLLLRRLIFFLNLKCIIIKLKWSYTEETRSYLRRHLHCILSEILVFLRSSTFERWSILVVIEFQHKSLLLRRQTSKWSFKLARQLDEDYFVYLH